MDEIERNTRLYKLVELVHDDEEVMELLATMIEKDNESMQFTFKLLTESSPLSNFFGKENMGEVFFDNNES